MIGAGVFQGGPHCRCAVYDRRRARRLADHVGGGRHLSGVGVSDRGRCSRCAGERWGPGEDQGAGAGFVGNGCGKVRARVRDPVAGECGGRGAGGVVVPGVNNRIVNLSETSSWS